MPPEDPKKLYIRYIPAPAAARRRRAPIAHFCTFFGIVCSKTLMYGLDRWIFGPAIEEQEKAKYFWIFALQKKQNHAEMLRFWNLRVFQFTLEMLNTIANVVWKVWHVAQTVENAFEKLLKTKMWKSSWNNVAREQLIWWAFVVYGITCFEITVQKTTNIFNRKLDR